MTNARGRPPIYTEESKFRIHTTGEFKLQPSSARKAVVMRIVDNGGVMSLGELNESFGFDVQPKVIALLRAGWLELVE
jgi:hypothetical protein